MKLIPVQCETNKKAKCHNGSRSTVAKRRSQKSKTSLSRMGYADENGQTYLPSLNDYEAWKSKIQKKGFTF